MLQHAFRAVVKPLMRSAKTFATASKFHVPTRRTLFTHQVNRRVLGHGSSPFSLDSTMFRTLTTDASGLTNNGSQEKQNGIFDPKTQVARDALENAKTALSEAEKKRDAAKEKWINATDEETKRVFLGVFKDAQEAVKDAQEAVKDAQKTYDLHVRGLANGNGQRIWERVENMDSYPAELLKAYHGTKELEKLEEELGGELAPGTWSSCGNVEHLGAGVFHAPNTPPIDTDSSQGMSSTLTRRETRWMARATTDALSVKRRVVVTGQPGSGKTRGGATATIQELLALDTKSVLRVGYKEDRVYKFELDDDTGQYTTWKFTGPIDSWTSTPEAQDDIGDTVAVVDPPESGAYRWMAPCRCAKLVSNNEKKHFHNVYKDGELLVTQMPTVEETLAAISALWTSNTAHPGDEKEPSNEAKEEEIRRRIKLVGTSWRNIFNWVNFESEVTAIMDTAFHRGVNLTPAELRTYYPGGLGPTTESRSVASASSKLFWVNPGNRGTSGDDDWTPRRARGKDSVELVMIPLARAVLSETLTEILETWGNEQWSEFEEACFRMMVDGLDTVAMQSSPKTPVKPQSISETFDLLKTLRDDDNTVVRASKNFPVLDFATSRTAISNAKVGKGQTETAMNALASFVLGIGVATENEDGTVKMEDTEFKAKLAILRNSNAHKHKLKPLHTQMELKKMTPQERARAKKRQQSLQDLW
eukprot:CAMPEP_0195506668 /NCGR_PEP_ID=MMETSP0794_2-20130614/242_1 /TAXON_ID=515487 /ORGANISM="Stephanopyxis turris, Strain CCMP 815" /LENGTH=701 /DNA_ID=CAMNT_0040633063 /DNA_START=113 /DNA_END=2215 /DNA_ORIENTATION=+